MSKTKNKETKIYLHIINPSIGIEGFEFFDLKQIKKIKKASISEIYIGDLLDYIDIDNENQIISEIINKLSPKGKLHVQGVDAKSLASYLIYNNINVELYRNILYNNNKKNIHTLGSLKNLLSFYGNLQLNKARYINNIQYYVEYILA